MEQHLIKGTSVKFPTGPDEQLMLITTATIEELNKLRNNSVVSASLIAALLGGTSADAVSTTEFNKYKIATNDALSEVNRLINNKADKSVISALEARIVKLEGTLNK